MKRTLLAISMLLTIILSSAVCLAVVSHPLTEIRPTNADFDMNNYGIMNISSVGIKTTSPQKPLHVNSTDSVTEVVVDTSQIGGDAFVIFDVTPRWYFGVDGGAGDILRLSYNGFSSLNMIMDTNDRVGFGTSALTHTWQTAGSLYAQSGMVIANGSDSSIQVNNPDNVDAIVKFWWLSNVAGIRYGGTGAGAGNGFGIVGPGEATRFLVDDAGYGAATNDVYISNSGSRNASLQVRGGSTPAQTALFVPNAAKGPYSSVIHLGANADWYIRSASGSGNVLIQNGSSGVVGIGTTSTNARLAIGGGAPTSGTAIYDYSANANVLAIWGKSDSGNGVAGSSGGTGEPTDSNAGVKGYGASTNPGKGVYGSGYYGLYGTGTIGLYSEGYYGFYASTASGAAALLAENTDFTAILSVGTTEVEYGGLCLDDLEGCSTSAVGDGDVNVRDGDICIDDGTGDCSSITWSDGDVWLMDGSVCVDDDAVGNDCDTSARTDGYIYAQTGGVTLIDLAENFPAETNISPGSLVVISPKTGLVCINETDQDCESTMEESIPFVKISDKSYEGSLLGVVSTEPGLLLGGFSNYKYSKYVELPIALAGRVPVKVTDENGPIYPGDPLTSSSKPGHAMKWKTKDLRNANSAEELRELLQTNEDLRESIIGKALQTHTAGEGEILVFVDLQ